MTKRTKPNAAKTTAAEVAYVTGAYAAQEAVDAMVETHDLRKRIAILGHCLNEIGNMRHEQASLGAAEILSRVMSISLLGKSPQEFSFKLGEQIALEAVDEISDLGTSYDRAEKVMDAALCLVADPIPNKSQAIKGFSRAITLALMTFLQQAREGMEAKNAKP